MYIRTVLRNSFSSSTKTTVQGHVLVLLYSKQHNMVTYAQPSDLRRLHTSVVQPQPHNVLCSGDSQHTVGQCSIECPCRLAVQGVHVRVLAGLQAQGPVLSTRPVLSTTILLVTEYPAQYCMLMHHHQRAAPRSHLTFVSLRAHSLHADPHTLHTGPPAHHCLPILESSTQKQPPEMLCRMR